MKKLLIDLFQHKDFVNRVSQTEIYNEGWMLRLTMNELEQELGGIDAIGKISFEDFKKKKGILWFSEALLPTPFPARSKDDHGKGVWFRGGENHTHADAIAGFYSFNDKGGVPDLEGKKKQETELKEIGSRFYVIEAKMNSELRQEVTKAKNYNQITRNIACIGKMIEISKKNLEAIDEGDIGFYLLCPKEYKVSIKEGTKGERVVKFSRKAKEIEKDNILKMKEDIIDQIENRLSDYKNQPDEVKQHADKNCEWLDKNYKALVKKIDIKIITWESLIDKVTDKERKKELEDFYNNCKIYNKIK